MCGAVCDALSNAAQGVLKKAVCACCFSRDGTLLIAVDASPQHTVAIYRRGLTEHKMAQNGTKWRQMAHKKGTKWHTMAHNGTKWY